MQFKIQWDITLHLSEQPSSNRLQIMNVHEEGEKREPLYTIAGDVNWYSLYGKQYEGSSKNQKQIYHIIQKFHSWGYMSKENENTNSKNTCAPMFITVLFTITNIWKQNKCSSTDE